MRKLQSTLVLILMFASSTPVVAQKMYYIEAAAGESSIELDNQFDHGSISEFSIGQFLRPDTSIQASFIDLNNYKVYRTLDDASIRISDSEIVGIKFLIGRHFSIAKNVFFDAKGGAFRWTEKRNSETVGNPDAINVENSTEKGYSIYLGLGFSYAINQQSRITLKYETYKTDNTDIQTGMLGLLFTI